MWVIDQYPKKDILCLMSEPKEKINTIYQSEKTELNILEDENKKYDDPSNIKQVFMGRDPFGDEMYEPTQINKPPADLTKSILEKRMKVQLYESLVEFHEKDSVDQVTEMWRLQGNLELPTTNDKNVKTKIEDLKKEIFLSPSLLEKLRKIYESRLQQINNFQFHMAPNNNDYSKIRQLKEQNSFFEEALNSAKSIATSKHNASKQMSGPSTNDLVLLANQNEHVQGNNPVVFVPYIEQTTQTNKKNGNFCSIC